MAHHHLIATQDFAGYKRGDHIDDEAEIARILSGEHAVHVNRVHARPKPADKPAGQAEEKVQ